MLELQFNQCQRENQLIRNTWYKTAYWLQFYYSVVFLGHKKRNTTWALVFAKILSPKLVKIRLAQYGKVRLLFQFHISEFAVNFNSNKCILPNYQNSTIISWNVTRQVSLLLVFISINATNQICLWVKILAIICYYVWDEFPSSKSSRCKLLLGL